jgi:SAM-dependent methyltransferase
MLWPLKTAGGNTTRGIEAASTGCCPICNTASCGQCADTPYWTCLSCDCWWQDPLPPKLYHGPHEAPGDAMGEADKEVNHALAHWLFGHVLKGAKGMTLDVGANYPWLAKCLRDLGCAAVAMDGSQDSHLYAAELGVAHLLSDFEEYDDEGGGGLSLITLVHAFEHLYEPIAALRKLRRLIAADGAVFIRMPDHRVPGFERDLTEGHYSIHPFFHTLTSVLQACVETKTFVVTEQYPLTPGQRDLVLRPL